MNRSRRTPPASWPTQPRGLHDRLCCKTEFVFTVDSGGHCDDCTVGEYPKDRCGQDDGGWL